MRLTHLKLAGFKSFVDPTTLHIHGQRVGVVGPNGCGKSNVMESVRWVLGESSAKEMRADAMDAVIFNGSSQRKPISRASVELVFDNSFGSAAGAWSQYAEISVKRVIERDKGSTYYINNNVVRRRDVADLFLGTGLGGRAYAIIGQNTISRIVEAKPEELRIFLEEAAGISKYKERRRETELRLRDTRENLTRVEDIVRELDKQITRLQSQAVVANQFHALQAELEITKGHVWLLKKRHASGHWEQTKRTVERLVNGLEAQVALLRSTERVLETARQTHLQTNEQVNTAQAQYYEANAEVSNLENQVKNTTDARERLQLQLQQVSQQLEKNTQLIAQTTAHLTSAELTLSTSTQGVDTAEQALKEAQAELPTLSTSFHTRLSAFNESQQALQHAQEQVRLHEANVHHLQRAINDSNLQLQRLTQSLSTIDVTEDAATALMEENLTVLHRHIASLEHDMQSHGSEESRLDESVRDLRNQLTDAKQALTIAHAEVNSLSKLQNAINHSDHQQPLSAWLNSNGLQHAEPLWQHTKIEAGWETALEALLSYRLNALLLTDFDHLDLAAMSRNRPPALLTLANKNNTISKSTERIEAVTAHSTKTRLIDKLSADIEHHCVLSAWLEGVYIDESHVDLKTQLEALKEGECIVNQQGDVFTPHSVSFFGAQSNLHGVLERQAQLDALNLTIPEHTALVASISAELNAQEAALMALKTTQQAHQKQLKQSTQEAHALNLSIQQKKQQLQSNLLRQKTVQLEIDNIQQKRTQLTQEHAEKTAQMRALTEQLPVLQRAFKNAEQEKQATQNTLNSARNHIQTLERELQEKRFNLKLNTNKLNELNDHLNHLHEENKALSVRVHETEEVLNATQMEALKQNLSKALNHKQAQEQILAAARNEMAAAETSLLQLERERMQHEQALHPLRDQLEASRLAEQEARLAFEQCQTALSASQMSEAELTTYLQALQQEKGEVPIKLTDLERKAQQLSQQITALGAVNLAAIEELQSEQTRKHYLDSQLADLSEASATLDDAIRKIDRETRGRLQTTFDEANRHFNELFTTLFGGGQARLELLGDEILDTGMQVFAQPPGKKNSTIHLLSGGEKALTALALVFALFRLNPAPFCLMDEVDAPLDDSNTERFCALVKKMSEKTQFLYVSHNKITMEMAQQLIGVTMQESGVSRIVDVDMEAAIKMTEAEMA